MRDVSSIFEPVRFTEFNALIQQAAEKSLCCHQDTKTQNSTSFELMHVLSWCDFRVLVPWW
jgi:hypothetical protein